MGLDPRAARDLMKRVARGERAAAATLFESHGDAVYRYLRGCGAGPADAEDLTQEVFMRALARASSYRGRGSLEGWLIRLARTRVIDRARQETARSRREREWAETREKPGDSPAGTSPGELSRLLGALAPEDREVIVLAKFLEFPTARIAEVLDVTAGAARVRLHRALRRLADSYQAVEAP
jgi:RNA polymerase sigma-70 factor (ECF subfamily)